MPVVVTVILALLVLINLGLMLVLLRRVANHDTRLAAIEKGAPTMADIGEKIEDFVTTTTDGEALRRDDLRPGTVIGFFDPDCEVCQSHVSGFVTAAGTRSGGDRSLSLAVIREAEEADLMADAFGPGIRSVIERRRGPVARAFHVMATPSFCTVGPGQIIASHDYEDVLSQ